MKRTVFGPDFRLDPPPPLPSCNPLNRDDSSPSTSSLSPSSTSQPPQVNTVWILQYYNVSSEVLSQLQSRMMNLSLSSSQMVTPNHSSISAYTGLIQSPEVPTTQSSRNSPNLSSLSHVAVTIPKRNNLLTNLELQSTEMTTRQDYGNSPDVFQIPQVPTSQCAMNSQNLLSLSHVSVPEDHSLLPNVELPTPQYHSNSPDLFHLHQVPTPQCRKNSAVSVPEDYSVLQNVELPTPRYHSNSPDLFHSHQVPTPQCRKNSATLHPFHNVLVSEDPSNSPNLFPSLKVPTSQTRRSSSNLHPLHHLPVTEGSTYSSNRPPSLNLFNSKQTRPQNHNRSQKFFPSSKRSAAPLYSEQQYRQRATICLFCKRNGESSEVFRSHNLKEDNGKITCPILFKYVCPTCQATGENAHTMSYCPANSPAISVPKYAQRCNPTGHPVYIKP